MARHAAAETDFVPQFPALIAAMANCWRTIGDAQAEVDPFGANYAALGKAREAIGAAVDRLTGQSGFLALTVSQRPSPVPSLARRDAVAS